MPRRQISPIFRAGALETDNFYIAVGRLVLMWGKLEQSLDNLVITAINIAKRTAPERQFFVPLGRKLTLFRELYSESVDLRPLERDAHALADEIEALGNHRHMIVHSNWLGFDDGPPPKLKMRHLKHKKGNITISRVTPTITDLARLAGAGRGNKKVAASGNLFSADDAEERTGPTCATSAKSSRTREHGGQRCGELRSGIR